MRTITKSLMAAAVAFVAAACGGSQGPTTELPADLRKDLELAKASGLELASSQRSPDAVVSALEIAPAGKAEQGDVAPRPVRRRQAPPEPAPAPSPSAEATEEAPVASEEAVAEAVVDEVPVEAAPAEVQEEVAPAPAVSEEPQVVTGPQAIPEEGSAPVRRPRGGLGGLGGIIGVVVRGGTMGVDDCAIHPRIPRRGGIAGGGPVYIPTPPVYGTGGRERVGAGPRSRGGSPAPTGVGGGRTRGVRM